jgi:small-conductance mechanosensitive channel
MSLDPHRLALERELLAALRSASEGLQQPQVKIQLHALFLEQAEAQLQPLLEEVREWTAGQIPRPSKTAVTRLQRLLGLSQDRQEAGLISLAEALHDAVVRASIGEAQVSAAACLRGAEELHRLLHQYAVGVSRPPSNDILADLR